MKTPSLFLIFFITLTLCACQNPWMSDILGVKIITFDSAGGSPVPSQKLFKGERVKKPADPEKPGSDFIGWRNDEYSEQLYDFSLVPIGDMTLYAVWDDGSRATDPSKGIPSTSDFDIEGTGTFPYDGNQKTVTVNAIQGITGMGSITVKYNGSTSAPSNVGIYYVTFDVAEGENYLSIEELEAGTLIIDAVFDNAEALKDYLNSLPSNNTSDKPYPVKLNFSYTTLNDSIGTIIGNGKNFLNLELISNMLTTIDESAFYYCLYLTGITIPDSVTSIKAKAFYQCSALTSVTIPSNVTSIGSDAFGSCPSLTSVTFAGTISPNNFDSSAFGGDLYDKYYSGGAGTYIAETTGTTITWTKIN